MILSFKSFIIEVDIFWKDFLMKIDDLRKSRNVEDRRGQSSYGGGGRSGFSGGGLLLQLLLTRGNWKMKIIIILIMLVMGGASGLGSIFSPSSGMNAYQSSQITKQDVEVSDQEAEFMSKVLASTEDFWTASFKQEGLTYNPTTLVLFTDQVNTACGQGHASSGPFYCPADKKVYIDMSFYRELGTRYGASGDFAMAYVIAHEVGHHVQNELGTMSQFHRKRQTLSEKEANALTVRLELQADYYAGAWAKYVDGRGLLEVGDIEEAMTAAHAVGDDHLQEQAYGRVMPDSFTHGTSEQRKRWFDRGYRYGDIEHGDTFSLPASGL